MNKNVNGKRQRNSDREEKTKRETCRLSLLLDHGRVRRIWSLGLCAKVEKSSMKTIRAVLFCTTTRDLPTPTPSEQCTASQDRRMDIFLLAEREISHMLADNLLAKFRGSDAYKELVDDDKLGS